MSPRRAAYWFISSARGAIAAALTAPSLERVIRDSLRAYVAWWPTELRIRSDGIAPGFVTIPVSSPLWSKARAELNAHHAH